MAIMGRKKQMIGLEMRARLAREEKLAREIAKKTKEEPVSEEEHAKRIASLKSLGLIKG
jgi:hypothetical protein